MKFGERRAAEVGPACGELRFVFPHLLPDESLNGLGLWRKSVDEIAVGLEVRHVHQASAHAFANDGLPLQRQADVGLRHTHAVGRGVEHEYTVAAYVGDAEVGLAVVVSTKMMSKPGTIRATCSAAFSNIRPRAF